MPCNKPAPDHSTLSRTRRLIDQETHGEMFRYVLKILANHGLIDGKTVGVDSTTLEANETGAMRHLYLRKRENIAKRVLIHAAGCNIGIMMRVKYGLRKTLADAGVKGVNLTALSKTVSIDDAREAIEAARGEAVNVPAFVVNRLKHPPDEKVPFGGPWTPERVAENKAFANKIFGPLTATQLLDDLRY